MQAWLKDLSLLRRLHKYLKERYAEIYDDVTIGKQVFHLEPVVGSNTLKPKE